MVAIIVATVSSNRVSIKASSPPLSRAMAAVSRGVQREHRVQTVKVYEALFHRLYVFYSLGIAYWLIVSIGTIGPLLNQSTIPPYTPHRLANQQNRHYTCLSAVNLACRCILHNLVSVDSQNLHKINNENIAIDQNSALK